MLKFPQTASEEFPNVRNSMIDVELAAILPEGLVIPERVLVRNP
jgi:hypothetical protein